MSNNNTQLHAIADRLVGGNWQIGPFYQVFKWGVGELALHSLMYTQEGDQLVSEGLWVWHPGQQKIKGYFVAVDMPVSLFEYEGIVIDGDTWTCEMVTYAPDNSEARHQEIWQFTSDDHYTHTVLTHTPAGLQETLSGEAQRSA